MLSVLFEDPALALFAASEPPLPDPVAERFASATFGLAPGTRLYSNFVSTLDGVVELGDPSLSSGAAISGRNPDDRFLMALLRACASHVLVGSGTFKSEPRHAWTAEAVFPALATSWAAMRSARRLAPQPTLLVASRRGDLDRAHAAFGAQEVRVISDLADLPLGPVLTEGGPRLMGSLLGRVDEVFLTVAPAVSGRGGTGRLGVIEGAEFPAASLQQHRLLSLRRSGSFLFARYQQL